MQRIVKTVELLATGCDRCKAFKQDEFMEEKSAWLLNTKSQHLFLQAAGLLGAGLCAWQLLLHSDCSSASIWLSHSLGCVPLSSAMRPYTRQLPGNTWGPHLRDAPGCSRTATAGRLLHNVGCRPSRGLPLTEQLVIISWSPLFFLKHFLEHLMAGSIPLLCLFCIFRTRTTWQKQVICH